MATKPENTFRASVHRYLPDTILHEKMNNPYSSGTADDHYSGAWADVWVEYKFIRAIPVRALIDPAKLLSPLQMKWLNDRAKLWKACAHRKVAVIIGCADGGVVFENQSWTQTISPGEFKLQLLPRRAVADWIVQQTTR
jgi:hypothetical protein